MYEESRQPCKGLINAIRFDNFGLKDTAKCFKACAPSGNEPCNLGNLQRYWLNYEIHLVEKSLTETVNMDFLKALVKNINTNISEDLHFSLTPSQIPKQVTEDEHRHTDRVRLPRSLFGSLQGSRPMVRLAITILDVGPGNVFKVRRGSGWLRFHAWLSRTGLPSLESLLRGPMGMEEVRSLWRVPQAAEAIPDPRL